MSANQSEERIAVITRRNRAMKGRIAAVCTAILIAGLLAACSGVQAARPAPASPGEATATRETQAGSGARPTAAPAAGAANHAPAGKASGLSLPAETRSSEGGGVTIQATPDGTAGGNLVISLSLNTHSVDLSYDYRALATLRDDQGHVYPAASWDGASGGHHVKGRLIFSNNPLQSVAGVKWIELEIKDVAGMPVRTFRWNVG
jgi:hypothetical protein